MDLLAILFFIGFLILQSMADTKRRQKAKELAEKRQLPDQSARPAPARELPEPWGGKKPEVHEREEPPVLPEPLPWELPWEMEEEEEEKEREIVSRPPQAEQPIAKPVVTIVGDAAKERIGPDWRQRVIEDMPTPVDIKTLVLPRFTYEGWTQGIIMAQVLQPPRARRRSGYPHARGKAI